MTNSHLRHRLVHLCAALVLALIAVSALGSADDAQATAPTIKLRLHNSAHQEIGTAPLFPATPVHAWVRVRNASGGNAPGNVDFERWDNGTCAGSAAYVQADVALSNGVAESFTFTDKRQGDRSYRVHYDGAPGVDPAHSACLRFTIQKKLSPWSVGVFRSDGTGPVTHVDSGEAVHASVQFQRVGGRIPGGTVDFLRWDNGTCSGPAAFTQSHVNLVEGHASSFNFTGGPGVRGYVVRYHGDSNFVVRQSRCLRFEVDP
ncbi:MAG: hypothetical protein WEB00_13900 [Dehalococcoidia bacterium]